MGGPPPPLCSFFICRLCCVLEGLECGVGGGDGVRQACGGDREWGAGRCLVIVRRAT